MIGLVLAVLYVGWKYMFGGDMPVEAAFIGAAGFLYVWYWIWTIVQGIFNGLVSLGIFGAGAVAGGGSRFGMLGGVLGGLAGGGLSVNILAIFAVKSAALLVGAYLLEHSGTATMAFAEFDTKKMVIGAILILVGLVMSSSSSSSD